jgi:small GTP-binding protein
MISKRPVTPSPKVVVIGSSGTGKTSIIHRLIYDTFDPNTRNTLGAALSHHHVTVNEKLVRLNIWDTAGQEAYRSLAKIYFRDCHCALVVFDVTVAESFEHVNYWLSELQQSSPADHSTVIVGNKIDLADLRKVTREEGHELARRSKATYIEVSAANGDGISDLFQEVGQLCMSQKREAAQGIVEKTRVKEERQNCC